MNAAEIMARAREAQHQWSNLSVSKRVQVLAGFRRIIAQKRNEIVAAVIADTGKTALDALSGDVLVTLEQMIFYERRAARLLRPRRVGKTRVLFPGCSFYEQYEPHGVALIYGPSNYPFQLTMVPALTALYAGNSAVIKVSERAPAVAKLISDLSTQLPKDLLQVIAAEPATAAALIDADPDIVFFTGSSTNGRVVASRAALRLIPTILELGGKDAALVFADCDLTRTIEGVVYGAFANAGQVCVGIKRLYVEQPMYEKVIALLRERVNQLMIGSQTDCDLPRIENPQLRQRLQEQVRDAVARGATLEAGGGGCDGPMLLTNVDPQSRVATEETFGPVLCVSSFRNESEAIALANSTPFALGASVWTRDLLRGRRVASALNAGTCSVNDVIRPIANPQAAFGGNGASGNGRYHGPHGLLAFTRVKTVMTLQGRRRREIHWFPSSERTRAGLDKLIELRHRPRGWLNAVRRILGLAALFTLYAAGAQAQSPAKTHLRLDVHLPKKDHGNVGWAVFDSPKGFPDDKTKAVRHGFTFADGTQSTIEIDAGPLPAGRYAVAAYLDENGNHKLDHGFLGIPKEPVGASNNPRGRLGPPHFGECAFSLGAQDETIQIWLVEPK